MADFVAHSAAQSSAQSTGGPVTSPTGRVDSNNGRSSPIFGQVYWAPTKSLWITFIYAGAILGGYATFSWSALLLCMLTTVITLCAGYSVGIHRRLIHRSFQCPQRLENLLVYLGVLTGIGGPFALVGRHDMQDWAVRSPRCHSYFSRHHNIFKDWAWMLHCDIELTYPPILNYEPRLAKSRFYQWLQQTWMLQQLPLAIAFYHFGGWSWVFWGVYVRIALSVTGHWLLGYLAHHVGDHPRWMQGASAQSYNVPFLGLLTLGECWQNNHQAFPSSAMLGHQPKQYDPGWWLIKAFDYVGLAWNIKRPGKRVLNRVKRPIAPKSPALQPPPLSTRLPKPTSVESRQKVTTS
ncbi:MAG: fatty acid desaturase [Cyanobacteria bacterium J06598_3]